MIFLPFIFLLSLMFNLKAEEPLQLPKNCSEHPLVKNRQAIDELLKQMDPTKKAAEDKFIKQFSDFFKQESTLAQNINDNIGALMSERTNSYQQYCELLMLIKRNLDELNTNREDQFDTIKKWPQECREKIFLLLWDSIPKLNANLAYLGNEVDRACNNHDPPHSKSLEHSFDNCLLLIPSSLPLRGIGDVHDSFTKEISQYKTTFAARVEALIKTKEVSKIKKEIEVASQHIDEKKNLYLKSIAQYERCINVASTIDPSYRQLGEAVKKTIDWIRDFSAKNLSKSTLSLSLGKIAKMVMDHSRHDAASFPCGSEARGGEEIDLRRNGSMSAVAPRNQYNLGICYAEVAVQMYDALMKSKRAQNRIKAPDPLMSDDFHSSALAAALADRGVNGGHTNALLWNLLRKGTCVQNGNNSEGSEKVVIAKLNHDLIELLSKYASHFDRKHSFWYSKRRKEEEKTEFSQELSALLSENGCNDSVIKEMLGFISGPGKIVEFLKRDSFKTSFSKLFKNFFQKECVSHSPPDSIIKNFTLANTFRESIGYVEDQRLAAGINALLEEKDPLPIALDICGKLLEDGASTRGLYYSRWRGKTGSLDKFNENVAWQKEECGVHSVIISGRKKKNGVCMYKTTNSWGSRCSLIWPNGDCDSATGEVWIDARDLMRNTLGFTSIRETVSSQ